ncbi:hypothetical protein D9619_003777 [Psilocybe cf. subviscida]|uniref:Uncharacterized protein n=1 Tax=Psilocybe cf. subviscida TaxID=2480587 RepID=A0A8H5ETK6_9AGAR|nr:hypothetical protein D9619_003777 [Psilocybe cf. subviscida]
MSLLLSSKPASIQFNLGVELIGCYVNLILYSIAMLCTYIYRRSERSKRDPLVVKLLVAANVVMDTVGTFGVCASYFYFSVTGWGLEEVEYRAHWSEPMWFICTAFSQVIVQTFMIRRYFVLSQQYITSAFITAIMLLSLGTSLYLAISSAVNLTALTLESRPADLKAVLTVAANLALAFAMFWKLKVTHTYSRIAQKFISRTYAVAIITGSVSSLAALATLISFLADPLSSMSTFFLSFIGRVYSLTILFTLLYRDMIVDDEWIQVDVSKAEKDKSDPGTIHAGVNESIPTSNTPVSDITFAHPDPDSASRITSSRNQIEESKYEADSGSTLQVAHEASDTLAV